MRARGQGSAHSPGENNCISAEDATALRGILREIRGKLCLLLIP